MRGLARPSAEVVWACLSPCVWVWGFWFGFALRCVALLCGVFVRLHLALFSAGGPFLPSLYVNSIYTRALCAAVMHATSPSARLWNNLATIDDIIAADSARDQERNVLVLPVAEVRTEYAKELRLRELLLQLEVAAARADAAAPLATLPCASKRPP
jgi:hypothetical protein